MEVNRQLPKERPSIFCKDEAQSPGRVNGVGQLQELRRLQAATTAGTIDRWADVVRSTDADTWPFLDQGACLVRFVERSRHDDRLMARFKGLGQQASRPERRMCREPLPDERKLEQVLRSPVHREVSRLPEAGGQTRPGYRQGQVATQ